MRLVVASGSTHKVAELRELLTAAHPKLEVLGRDSAGRAPEIDETEDTFEGNATLKARGIAQWLREQGERDDTWVLADDSGICIDALGGAPGVRSARFAGDRATDAENNLAMVAALERAGVRASAAHYACVLVLCQVAGGQALAFEGRWDVEVRVQARGTGGFGYDPHAWIEGGARTVAELPRADKSDVSHRGRALRALLAAWPG